MNISSMPTAADAVARIVQIQQALTVMSFLDLAANKSPYDRHVTNNTVWDYIIIGGGTSGCVVANRLSKDSKVSVLLVEAGDDFQMENTLPGLGMYNKRSRLDWNYTANYDHNYARAHQSGQYYPTLGKVLGGSSSVDPMLLYTQGEDREYNNAAALTGEPSWRFENILRLYKKVERFNDEALKQSANRKYHGFSGKVGLVKDHSPINTKYFEALKSVGFEIVDDINGINRLGFTDATFYIDKHMRQNSAFAYLFPVRDRTNLVVLKNTHVTKIIFDEKKNAVGVEAVNLKTKLKYVFKTRREVILTAGTFNTPKLLQLSGIGPKALLRKFRIPVIVDAPYVGSNYQNHVAIPMFYVMDKTCKSPATTEIDLHKWARVGGSFVGHVSLNKSNTYADYRTISFLIPFSPATPLLQFGTFILRFKYEITEHWVSHAAGRELLVTYLQDSKPVSRGQVLIQSRDPFVKPSFTHGLLSNEIDVTNIIKYANDFRRILESPYFKKVGAVFVDATEKTCGKIPAYSDRYWRCYIKTMMAPMNHHAGTASMGLVVDGRLRVIGVKGLRVADASVMSEICSGSITIPAMVIGENAAVMINKDWQRKSNSNQLQI